MVDERLSRAKIQKVSQAFFSLNKKLHELLDSYLTSAHATPGQQKIEIAIYELPPTH
jgi:hypothetical protein